MGFDIQLSGGEWKKLAKTALRTEVYGGGSSSVALMVLVGEAEERQKRWHEDRGEMCKRREELWGKMAREGGHGEGGKCEALGAEGIRKMVGGLRWD